MLLPTNKGVPGLIYESAKGFNLVNNYPIVRTDSVFTSSFCPLLSLAETQHCADIGQGMPASCFRFPICSIRHLLPLRDIGMQIPIISGVKPKKKEKIFEVRVG